MTTPTLLGLPQETLDRCWAESNGDHLVYARKLDTAVMAAELDTPTLASLSVFRSWAILARHGRQLARHLGDALDCLAPLGADVAAGRRALADYRREVGDQQ